MASGEVCAWCGAPAKGAAKSNLGSFWNSCGGPSCGSSFLLNVAEVVETPSLSEEIVEALMRRVCPGCRMFLLPTEVGLCVNCDATATRILSDIQDGAQDERC